MPNNLRALYTLTYELTAAFAIGCVAWTGILIVDTGKWVVERLPRTFGQGPRRKDEFLP